MRARWRWAAAGVPPGRINEFERPQRGVHRIDLVLETLDLGGGDAQCAGSAPAVFRRAQIRAEVEEIVLDAVEHLVCRLIGVQAGDPDRRVCFVDGAISGDAQAMLRHAGAVAERGLATIAAARVDPGQPNHLRSLF